MCLVPNMVVPKKFRVLEFIKYSGTQCLMTHIKSYCNKMAKVIHNEKLLMHFFQDSLSGITLSRYMILDNTKIRRWKDLVMLLSSSTSTTWMLLPTEPSCPIWKKRTKKSIKGYAQRWRESVAQVHPPLLDKEMVTLFADTLKVPYYEHVTGSSV
jgi:hypothetical protein